MGLCSNGPDGCKCDLHVNTPSSALENQYNNDWEVYFTKIEIFSGEIAVAGIADYWTITGYELLRTSEDEWQINNITETFPYIYFSSHLKLLLIHSMHNPCPAEYRHYLYRQHFK